MKRSLLFLLTTGISAAAVLPLAGVAAAADPVNTVNLAVTNDGIKKAAASWDAWSTGPAFDAYLVTADDDSSNGPFAADRSRYVDDAASRSVTFDDLTSGTTYFFRVYAVDYTDTGVNVVPPTGEPANTPIGIIAAEGSTLTIVTSADTVLSGKNLVVSGNLTGDAGARVGAEVTVESDPYPFDGAWTQVSTTTVAAGRWSHTFNPTVNTRFRAFYTQEGIGGWTRNVTVEVRKKISIVVNPGATISAGTQLKYTGKLGGSPSLFQPPIADPAVKACLQRFSGTWRTIKCVAVNQDGTYLLKHQPGADQDGKYRIYSG
ncbi:MAG: fibronectin type III domain-containing protein, partial [Candidatus Nanopelagicales bacterium]